LIDDKIRKLAVARLCPLRLSSFLFFLPSTFDPAAMDEGEIIYSTPLPGDSPIPAPTAVPAFAPQPQPQQLQQPLPTQPQPPTEKPADYVYYERRPDDLSSDARARATAAKVKLESHYRFALETAIDLNVR
jgi:protein-serine/threonine kinase